MVDGTVPAETVSNIFLQREQRRWIETLAKSVPWCIRIPCSVNIFFTHHLPSATLLRVRQVQRNSVFLAHYTF